MKTDSIQTYEKFEKYYWWWVGRRFVIEKMLKKYFNKKNMQILDWGCGPGGNFLMLKKYGKVLGVDSSPEAVKLCQKKGINILHARTLDSLKTNKRFDLITNFDVLEHIAQDKKYLKNLQRILKSNGCVMVTVPAYKFLWSGLDKVLGHKRRYSLNELILTFEESGYRVIKASYFICFISPFFILYRFFEETFKKNAKKSLKSSTLEFPKPINWFLTKLVYLEGYLMQYINLPFGTSIFLLATVK